MEAGISDHVWAIQEMCALLPKQVSATTRLDKQLIQEAMSGRFSKNG
jgi:hypothetical protein